MRLKVRPYVPNPRRCFKCQRYGHGSQSCRGRQTCAKCGEHDHPSDDCMNTLHCINCDGEHAAYSRSCSIWKREKYIVTLKVKENISFQEARKRILFMNSTCYADAARKGAAPQRSHSDRGCATSSLSSGSERCPASPEGRPINLRVGDLQGLASCGETCSAKTPLTLA